MTAGAPSVMSDTAAAAMPVRTEPASKRGGQGAHKINAQQVKTTSFSRQFCDNGCDCIFAHSYSTFGGDCQDSNNLPCLDQGYRCHHAGMLFSEI